MSSWFPQLLPSLVLACAAASQVSAAPAFRTVGEKQPFQAEVITEVYQDRQGFLWIGTREGLFLHDGQRFRKFQHEGDNPDSISDSGIRGVFEDSRGRLWINTINGGLNLLDRARWRFKRFRHEEASGALSHDGVFALAEADDGSLWVGTQAGLDLFDPRSGRAHAVRLQPGGGEFIMTLLRDRDGRLWVGTLGHGLFRERERGGGTFERILAIDADTGATKDVFSVAQDPAGRVWVGTRNGLFRFDARANRLVKPPLSPASLADELVNVTELELAPDGAIWIGTFGVGLYRLDTRRSRIEAVDMGVEGAGAQHIDQGALLVDHQSGLIVGTFGAGLLRKAEPVLDVGSYRAERGDAPGLRHENVYSLSADGDSLLVGSFGGGVQRLKANGTLETLPVPKSEGRMDGVVTMQRARDGALWVGTSNGIYRQDADGTTQLFPIPSGSRGAANPGYVSALMEDRSGRIWAGSGGAGLYRFRPDRGDFLVYRPRAGDPRSLSDDYVSTLMEDRRGRLWVGTRSGGISLCTVRGEQLDCERLRQGLGDTVPSHDHIADLLEAPDGSIWVGTGGGLNRFTLDDAGRPRSVQVWRRAEGLVDDNVMALARTPDGALWISTRVGLSRLDPQGRFENYTVADGLPSAVFNPKAVAWLGNRLYLGSARGVVSIDPARWRKRGSAPPVVLTAIEGLEQHTTLPQPTWLMRNLRVPWNRPFSIEFAVLSFDGGEPEYEYRLRDDEAWIPLGNRSQLTLHALPPGAYRASVRGRQSGATWTTTSPLAIEIYPPWWRQAWVWAVVITLAFVALALGFLWRMRALQRRNRDLQMLQQQKDMALTQARDSRDHLESAFASLRRLTMQLEAAKEEERKHLARELHDEFGQALTAAKINLRLAATHPGTALAEERTTETIDLIERLIGQVRALSFDLRPPLLDELGLAAALEAYLRGVAQRTGQRIDFALPASLPRMGPAREIAAFRIVQEAVTNCLRHAGGEGFQVALQSGDGGVDVQVHDDGIGFDAEAVLAEGDPRGFGLLGMRERVEELGGRWTLRSRPGQGTTIKAFIPTEPVDVDARHPR